MLPLYRTYQFFDASPPPFKYKTAVEYRRMLINLQNKCARRLNFAKSAIFN